MDKHLEALEQKANAAEQEAMAAIQQFYGEKKLQSVDLGRFVGKIYYYPNMGTTTMYNHDFDQRSRTCRKCGMSMVQFHLTRDTGWCRR